MYDTVIVGAGPAGMTAALYLLRLGRRVLLLESDSFGGQIASSPSVANYPGIPNIAGLDFADALLSQVTEPRCGHRRYVRHRTAKDQRRI